MDFLEAHTAPSVGWPARGWRGPPVLRCRALSQRTRIPLRRSDDRSHGRPAPHPAAGPRARGEDCSCRQVGRRRAAARVGGAEGTEGMQEARRAGTRLCTRRRAPLANAGSARGVGVSVPARDVHDALPGPHA
eukprot:366097-Chlamydomonas_euryale.AAC.45